MEVVPQPFPEFYEDRLRLYRNYLRDARETLQKEVCFPPSFLLTKISQSGDAIDQPNRWKTEMLTDSLQLEELCSASDKCRAERVGKF